MCLSEVDVNDKNAGMVKNGENVGNMFLTVMVLRL